MSISPDSHIPRSKSGFLLQFRSTHVKSTERFKANTQEGALAGRLDTKRWSLLTSRVARNRAQRFASKHQNCDLHHDSLFLLAKTRKNSRKILSTSLAPSAEVDLFGHSRAFSRDADSVTESVIKILMSASFGTTSKSRLSLSLALGA